MSSKPTWLLQRWKLTSKPLIWTWIRWEADGWFRGTARIETWTVSLIILFGPKNYSFIFVFFFFWTRNQKEHGFKNSWPTCEFKWIQAIVPDPKWFTDQSQVTLAFWGGAILIWCWMTWEHVYFQYCTCKGLTEVFADWTDWTFIIHQSIYSYSCSFKYCIQFTYINIRASEVCGIFSAAESSGPRYLLCLLDENWCDKLLLLATWDEFIGGPGVGPQWIWHCESGGVCGCIHQTARAGAHGR